MENLKALKDYIIQNRKKPIDWVNGLEDRKKEELEFHNLDRETNDEKILKKQEQIKIHANRSFYSIAASSDDYARKWVIKNSLGKVFLDYACGRGNSAIAAAKSGALLSIGIDISDVSIENAQKIANAENLGDICLFMQADCEDTKLPSDSIDTIICQGMLHHLDLYRAFPELLRILKPGGKILCVEALSANPIIQYYRDRTPQMRTEWETKHILGMKDIKHAKTFFNVRDIKFWYLFSLGAVPFRNTILFKPIYAILNFIDSIVLRIPYIQLMAWQFTFILEKPIAKN